MYLDIIRQIDPTINAVGVEASMRNQYGTLGHLSRELFAEEIRIAREAEAYRPGFLKACASSHGMDRAWALEEERLAAQGPVVDRPLTAEEAIMSPPRWAIRCNVRFEKTEEGAWWAVQPAGAGVLTGFGPSPEEALVTLCRMRLACTRDAEQIAGTDTLSETRDFETMLALARGDGLGRRRNFFAPWWRAAHAAVDRAESTGGMAARGDAWREACRLHAAAERAEHRRDCAFARLDRR